MSWLSRLQLSTMTLVFSVMLGFFALGFAGLALFMALSEFYQPPIASLITAFIYIGTALLLTLIVAMINNKQKNKHKKKSDTSQQDVDALLDQFAHPALAEWIKQHPGKSVVTTLIAGAVVGYSAEARDMLKAFSQQCKEKT